MRPFVLTYIRDNRKPEGVCRVREGSFSTAPDQSWAVNYNGVYQYVKYGYVLQFDGHRNVGLYRLGDHKMEHNLLGSQPETEQRMQRELKALIQQYMQRMLHDRLTTE